MRVWNLDSCCNENGSEVQIYLPGPPGPPITDVGSFLEPVVITDSIAAPIFRRQRSFVSAASDIVQPVLPNPSDNGPWEWFIYNVGPDTIELNDALNLKLSGQIVMNPDTILYLQWDGNSRYVEGGRNEI